MILSLTKAKRFDLLYEYIESIKRHNRKVWDTGGVLSKLEIDYLEERGFIINNNQRDDSFLDSFVVTDKFDKMFKVVDLSKAAEFWVAYPQTILVNGTKYNAKNVEKDSFLLNYVNVIGNNEAKHKKILATLEDHKRKGLINSKIDKWFNGKPWEDFEETLQTKSDVL
jgi:hypothetical protein